MRKEKRQTPHLPQRRSSEEISPDNFPQNKASGQSGAVEKKSQVNKTDITAGNRNHKPNSLDQELTAGYLSKIEFIGQYTPDKSGAELSQRYSAHKRSGNERRVADIGDIRKDVQIETSDADAGDTEGDYEKPKYRQSHDLGPAP